MRFRFAATAVATAAALVLGLAGSASAAEGTFLYRVKAKGQAQQGALTNPASHRCLNLPKLRPGQPPAFGVENKTNATALVYVGDHCSGQSYLVPAGASAPKNVHVRSVVFES